MRTTGNELRFGTHSYKSGGQPLASFCSKCAKMVQVIRTLSHFDWICFPQEITVKHACKVGLEKIFHFDICHRTIGCVFGSCSYKNYTKRKKKILVILCQREKEREIG